MLNWPPQEGEFLGEIAKLRGSYLDKMDDDFNTAGAVSDLFEMSRAINRFIDQHQFEDTAKQRTPENLASLRLAHERTP